jgi:hypothetical protein
MGGLVYNTHRGVAVVKAKHAPCQPRSSLQLLVRALAVTLIRQWQSLATQALWNAYASLHPYVDGMGNQIRASGANWYVALSTRLARRGLTIVSTPPLIPAPAALTALTATDAGDHIEVDWLPLQASGFNVEVWIDGPHSAGRAGSLPAARFNMDGDGAVGAANTGPCPAGRYTIYGRVISTDDGQVSSFLSVDVDRA